MNWLQKCAMSDVVRIKRNIARLENLKQKVHELGYFAVATQSGGFHVLSDLLEENIVLGRPLIHEKLYSALIGENNQKIALDAPLRFKEIMKEAEDLVDHEIDKERRELRKILSKEDE